MGTASVTFSIRFEDLSIPGNWHYIVSDIEVDNASVVFISDTPDVSNNNIYMDFLAYDFDLIGVTTGIYPDKGNYYITTTPGPGLSTISMNIFSNSSDGNGITNMGDLSDVAIWNPDIELFEVLLTITMTGSGVRPQLSIKDKPAGLSTNTFTYNNPIYRSLSSLNSSVDNNGVILYNGRPTVLGNTLLNDVKYTSWTNLSNDTGYFLLDISLSNLGNGIVVNYTNTYNPYVTSVTFTDVLTITFSIPIPNAIYLNNVSSQSLGFPSRPKFIYTVDPGNPNVLYVDLVGSTMKGLLSPGNYADLSLLMMSSGGTLQ